MKKTLVKPQETHSSARKHTGIHHDDDSKSELGFWVYLMTDCMLFASLFATYAVLRNGVHDGPTSTEIVNLNFVLIETLALLTSSFLFGFVIQSARKGKTKLTLGWLSAVAVLGVSFICMELYEFTHLAHEGHSWRTSAFLSSFFTLVGTHGIHIIVGLLWIFVMFYLITKRGISSSITRKLRLLGMFWHFLDVIWIFIFTIVYLLGAL
jgi:cytochrome o ubiquinol oxidase subunit 3